MWFTSAQALVVCSSDMRNALAVGRVMGGSFLCNRLRTSSLYPRVFWCFPVHKDNDPAVETTSANATTSPV